MFLFLSILLGSLVIAAVCAAMLSSAAAAEAEKPALKPGIEVQPSRFFAAAAPSPADPRALSAELLLSQIERHVRLEQAAAERFVSLPTIESLQAPTDSNFVN